MGTGCLFQFTDCDHSNANIPRVHIGVHMGIFKGKNN